MASDRIKRQIERLLDSLEEAVDARDWELVRQLAEDVLVLDPDNVDAPPYLAAAERAIRPNRSDETIAHVPEQNIEISNTFRTPVDNPNPSPIDISAEEFTASPTEIADASSKPFAQARVRVVVDEVEESASKSNSEVLARAITPVEAVIKAFTHCFDWSGRANRSEFWWYWLFFLLVYLFADKGIFFLVAVFGDNEYFQPVEKYPYLYLAKALVFLPPLAFLILRRLRDAGQSIWWVLLVIPGWIHMFTESLVPVYPDSLVGVGMILFHLVCLSLCAMPGKYTATAWAPRTEKILKGIGLIAIRVLIGLVILIILLQIFNPLEFETSAMPVEGLTEGMLRTVLRQSLFFAYLHIALIPLLFLQNRWQVRSA